MGKKTEKRNGYDSSVADGVAADVLPFYSDKVGMKYREFSNFFSDMPPYEFILPDYARPDGFPRTVTVEFSEKAVMLVKAGLFKDRESFQNILRAPDPNTAKKLGRGVRNFDVDEWEKHLEETAFQCVLQKFASSASLRKLLLQTGDKILAEAAPKDAIWGIGLPKSDDRCYYPDRWCGRNVLGYALMAARSRLRGDTPQKESENVLDTAGAAACPALEKNTEATSKTSDTTSAESPGDATATRTKRWGRST